MIASLMDLDDTISGGEFGAQLVYFALEHFWSLLDRQEPASKRPHFVHSLDSPVSITCVFST